MISGEKIKKRRSISAWATKWDPRIPPKGQIIHEFKNILYSDPACKKIFPEGSIIPSNRRLRNIGEILKPTIPNRFPQHGPKEDIGFFKCTRCDLCKHIPENKKKLPVTLGWKKMVPQETHHLSIRKCYLSDYLYSP
jgi:hypothetical protein